MRTFSLDKEGKPLKLGMIVMVKSMTMKMMILNLHLLLSNNLQAKILMHNGNPQQQHLGDLEKRKM